MNTFLNGISLNRVNCSKCLGVEIDEFLTWETHIASVSKKVSSGISIMRKVKPFIPISSLLNIYQSIVEPYFDYCSIVGMALVTTWLINSKNCKIERHG